MLLDVSDVNIGSGNGMFPDTTKLTTEQVLTQFFHSLWYHQGPMG